MTYAELKMPETVKTPDFDEMARRMVAKLNEELETAWTKDLIAKILREVAWGHYELVVKFDGPPTWTRAETLVRDDEKLTSFLVDYRLDSTNITVTPMKACPFGFEKCNGKPIYCPKVVEE